MNTIFRSTVESLTRPCENMAITADSLHFDLNNGVWVFLTNSMLC